MAVQCSTCDNVSTLIDAGDRDIEGLAQILGSSSPAMLTHLKDHTHPRLHDLTYHGQAVAGRTTNPSPSAPLPADRGEAGERMPPATGGADLPETPNPAPPAPTADETVSGFARERLGIPDEGSDQHAASPSSLLGSTSDAWEGEIYDKIDCLRNTHPDERVRVAACDLLSAMGDWADAQLNAARRAELRKRRDQLQADLDQLQADLDQVSAEIERIDAPKQGKPATVNMAQVRTWAIAEGIHVAPTGKIARAIVDDYLAAHPAVS